MGSEQVELADFTKPKRNFKVFWAVFITVVIMGGGGAYGYYCLDNNNKADKEALNKKIEVLQSQVGDLSGVETTDELDDLSEEPLDPNLSTKEYISSKLGITLRYPKAYFAEEIGSGENTYLIIDKKAIDSTIPANSEFPQQYFMISKLDELCGLSSVKSMAVSEKVTDTKIAEQNGWKFTMTKPSDLDSSFSSNYYFNSSTDCYHISAENSDAKGTHDSAINDIISSITLNK